MLRLVASFLLAFCAAAARPACAQERNPDALFDRGEYQAALEGYQGLLKSSDQDTRLTALYRAAECQALLFRYAEAAQRVFSEPLPSQAAWRARFLILRSELAREFLKQYGRVSSEDEEGSADLTKRTPEQWHGMIRAAYQGLWDIRPALAGVPIRREGYFIDLKDADLSSTPTLWDFAAMRMIDYLLNEAPADKVKPAAADFFKESFEGRLSLTGSPATAAGVVAEDASRLPGAERDAVRPAWKVKRATIPLRAPDRVVWSDPRKADEAAAAALLRRWHETLPGSAAGAAGLEAARLLHSMGSPDDALVLLRGVEQRFPQTAEGRQASRLRTQIELPELRLETAFAPPPGKGSIAVRTRNLPSVHLRLYRVAPSVLKVWETGRQNQAWSALRQPDEKLVAAYALKSPDHAWDAVVRSSSSIHLPAKTQADPPPLAPGLYLAMASSDREFKPGASLLSAAILNVTRLALVATAGPKGPERDFVFDPASTTTRRTHGIHLYALDAVSGQPRAADVDAFLQRHWGSWETLRLQLDDSGRASVPVSIDLTPWQPTSFSLDPLASFQDSYAYLSYPANFYYTAPPPIQVFLETDRPIYRPGQEVALKATVLARIPRGYKVYDGKSELSLSVRDAGGQEFLAKSLKLNSMGSASIRFALPQGRLLGRYSVTGTIQEFGRPHSGWGGFSVEEYKRPEFEVTIDPAAGPWKYGEAATVKGQAKYYFGGAVQDAAISYKVYREPYWPWWCWWWRPSGSQERTLVASGTTRTDQAGTFSAAFTPAPPDDTDKEPRPSRFTAEVDSRDPGGRTISARRSFMAGAKAFLFSLTPSAGFFSAAKEASVELKLLNLDEQPVAGKAEWELFRVDGEPAPRESGADWSGAVGQSTSLEEAFKNVPNGPRQAFGAVQTKPAQAAKLAFGRLEAGVYRLSVSAIDPWGGKAEQSIILISAGNRERPGLSLPAIAIPERRSYLPGEKARLLLGSGRATGATFVEVWSGPFLLESRLLAGGGVQVLALDVSSDYRGGVSVRWFSARDFRLDGATAELEVPWKDRELSVQLKHDKVLRPGQRASWRLQVSGPDGRPVNGEAVVRVFDRSLEYYMAAAKSWLSELYPSKGPPPSGLGSIFQASVLQLPVTEGWVKIMLDSFRSATKEQVPPTLRFNKGRAYPRRRFGMLAKSLGGRSKGMGAEDGMAVAGAGAAASAEMSDKLTSDYALPGSPTPKTAAISAPAAVPVRTDFAETAVFEPQLKVGAGAASFGFRVPERLTSWKIQASVLTRDVKRGTVEAESVTKKELMVRLELPRYLREGDQGTIKAVVNNGSKEELSGELTLGVSEDGSPASAKLGLAEAGLGKPFSVKPGAAQAVAWALTAPRGQSVFKVRSIVRSGNLTDAEERELPILPSRSRLIETAFVSLDGTAKKALKLAGFDQPDPTRQQESLTLQLDPQLALSVLNSLPFLVNYPYECVEQTLDRFVPLGIVDAFYAKRPELAQAVRKLPKRDTITPAWDRSDPRRLMELIETPWAGIAAGRKSPWPLVDLFDPPTVKAELSASREKLAQAQNPDGSFPWFPGGRPDPYMTLLVLEGFAEARRYGVDVPRDSAARALRYVLGEIPRRLKEQLQPDEGRVAIILYAAYVVTSEASYRKEPGVLELARAWVDFADKHASAMTPLGKAYAAHVYWQLGEKAKGDLYLRRAMDGSREDPVAGVYWTPEKLSWLWYSDTLEKHAFLLRTLLVMHPDDHRIPGMVQWLLFNRKGNEWKSTKASAAAIYSLLDVLKTRGALDRGDSYSVRWGGTSQDFRVEPLEWLSRPLRWTKRGAEIGPKDGVASIAKEGPGLGFASLTWIFTTDRPAKASGPGLVELDRKFFKRVQDGAAFKLQPLASGESVSIGDEIVASLTLTTRSQFEYMHLKDPKLSGFEATELLSGWKWDRLSRYEEPRDSVTNFFLDWVPHGEYVLRTTLRPSVAGRFRVGPAVLQSMYAPEMAAHSDSFELIVK